MVFAVVGWSSLGPCADTKESLQQQLGKNVAAAQKLVTRQSEIQAELQKIPKVLELSKESNEIQGKLQKLNEENQTILKKLDGLK